MKTPVVLIIYHRPSLVKKVVDAIREAKPHDVFVVADGPKDKIDEELCLQTRKEIDKIDWECEVHKKYSSRNLGLRNNVANGLNWVFDKVDRAVILEEDLLIDKSFFRFCDELLEKYENNDKIISISGNNFLFGEVNIKESYYFSKYVYSWGWATWRRAWKLYDNGMKDWLSIRKTNYLKNYFKNFSFALYWEQIFDLVYKRDINSWAYCWMFTAFKNTKFTIVPNKNLVSNVGYGKEATNTFFRTRTMNMKTEAVSFPLIHPKNISTNLKADNVTKKNIYLNLFVLGSLIARIFFNKINGRK